MTARYIGVEDDYDGDVSYRVLRHDEDDDVTVVVRTGDKTRACRTAEDWIEKWAEEYPDDILWLEERVTLPWSTVLSR